MPLAAPLTVLVLVLAVGRGFVAVLVAARAVPPAVTATDSASIPVTPFIS
jgi:hypothetical protein